MEKGKTTKGSKPDGKPDAHHTPETELSFVVLQAGEMGDVRYLKDYLEMTKLSGELNVNECDSKGCTPLHFAVASKKLDVVKTLVEYGANVNQKDLVGFTALFWATGRYANVEIARYLMETGRASVHITTQMGACALHGAALQGNIGCIELLLQYGADARCTDCAGNKPIDLAMNDKTRAVLQKALTLQDENKSTQEYKCSHCGTTKETSKELKRCARCYVTKYCNRKCQITHWKGGHRKSCTGSLMARPRRALNISAASSQNLFVLSENSEQPHTQHAKHKIFLVKVQVPVGPDGAPLKGEAMMVYNEDRSVTGFIYDNEKGYDALLSLISKEGYIGIKAFFWAELSAVQSEGTPVKQQLYSGNIKIFHGCCAPYQTW